MSLEMRKMYLNCVITEVVQKIATVQIPLEHKEKLMPI